MCVNVLPECIYFYSVYSALGVQNGVLETLELELQKVLSQTQVVCESSQCS